MSLVKPSEAIRKVGNPAIDATKVTRSTLFSLPPQIAQTRLKLNLASLFFLTTYRYWFTPLIQIKAILIYILDEYLLRSEYDSRATWGFLVFIELPLATLLSWNILQALISIRNPQPLVIPKSGIVLTPIRMSSPLTRPAPSPSSSSPLVNSSRYQNPTSNRSIGNGNSNQTPQRQLASTPNNNRFNTPNRSSPLSSSTSKLFNVSDQSNLTPSNGTPRSNGLFYPEDIGSSPSKFAKNSQNQQSQAQQNSQQSNSGGVGNSVGGNKGYGDFVMIEREEKEWVENVWKGVRGKGGKIAI